MREANVDLRILVTGATGFVGSAVLARAALDPTLQLRGAVRRAVTLADGVEPVAIGDLAPEIDRGFKLWKKGKRCLTDV